MAVDLGRVSQTLFAQVMAPMVLGGAVRPPHAIGARVAMALGEAERLPADLELASHVQVARVRRARRLVAVDRFGPPTSAEWALAAGLSDILQAANPTFDAALRRGPASRILAVATAGIERVPLPSSPKDALSRHTWFAPLLYVARTDTTISWWVGSRTYLGVEPPKRLRAWPSVRRVTVSARATPLLELAPLAFERGRLVAAVSRLLERSPLTDLATCSRASPPFAWTPGALALVAASAGRALALRALARLPALAADAALGRASRELLRRIAGSEGSASGATTGSPLEGIAVASLLTERTIGLTQSGEFGSPANWPEDAAFARAIGATAATAALAEGRGIWSADQRRALLDSLEPVVSSTHGMQATAVLKAAGLS